MREPRYRERVARIEFEQRLWSGFEDNLRERRGKMANTISVEAVDNAGETPVNVKVKVESPGERDMSAKVNGVDLIQQVASALRVSVTVGEMTGSADDAA